VRPPWRSCCVQVPIDASEVVFLAAASARAILPLIRLSTIRSLSSTGNIGGWAMGLCLGRGFD
jgi:hypothetical protein